MVYGCSRNEATVDQSNNVNLSDNNKSNSSYADDDTINNDNASCLTGLDEILSEIRNESKAINASKAISIMICSENISNALQVYKENQLEERMLVDIMHVWLFYLVKDNNIANKDLIAEVSSEIISNTTSFSKEKVKSIILKFLTDKNDNPDYPDDLGIFKGRDIKIILDNAETDIDKLYFENLIVLNEAKKSSECSKISISDYRDELLQDACKLLFVDNLDAYCSTMK
jgi:hypothetical protein